MGIVVMYAAADEARAQAWQEDPESFVEFMMADEEENGEELVLDVDKAWHGIHWMLTGGAEPSSHPLSAAVFGGTPFTEDLDYGPARMLAPGDVAALSARLNEMDEQAFRSRYAPEAMDASGVYPEIWTRDGEEGLDYLVYHYNALRQFYADAAQRGAAVVTWMS